MKLASTVVFALYAASALHAADPTGESILERYIEVTGGKAAYTKVRNRVTVAKMDLTGKGITASMRMTHAEPAKSHTVVEFPGVAKIEEGTDGTVVWENSALRGPRIKTGAEKALALRGANMQADLRWRDVFKKVEYTGVEPVDGKICHRVSLTPHEGNTETRYYDKDSGLLVRTSMIVATEMGEIPAEISVSDYRSVDGILLPFQMKQKAAGMEFTITLESVRHNADLPANEFALPDAVKALLARQ